MKRCDTRIMSGALGVGGLPLAVLMRGLYNCGDRTAVAGDGGAGGTDGEPPATPQRLRRRQLFAGVNQLTPAPRVFQ